MSVEPKASERAQLIITIAIGLTTVALAVVGFLQVRASSKSNDAAQTAQKRSALTMASLLQAQEQAKVDYEEFLRAEE